jgi:DnaJ-class molecular chaperone
MPRSRSSSEIKRVLADPLATHYEVLGVGPGDDEHDLKKARLYVVAMFHPDRWEDRRAHDFASRANVAHATLTDVAARRLYDAFLLTSHVKCQGCEGLGFVSRQRGFKAVTKLTCGFCLGGGWLRKAPAEFEPTKKRRGT